MKKGNDMYTVMLQQSPFVREMEQIAAHQNTTTEKLFNQAVSQFLYRVALEKMKAETEAFAQMHDQLVTNYLGHYVAIHNGEVVDHDPDLPTLRHRIRQRFERLPILLREVTPEAKQREIVIRSPRLTV
jgi:hypothetical protein